MENFDLQEPETGASLLHAYPLLVGPNQLCLGNVQGLRLIFPYTIDSTC
jgi:hypothetical protein